MLVSTRTTLLVFDFALAQDRVPLETCSELALATPFLRALLFHAGFDAPSRVELTVKTLPRYHEDHVVDMVVPQSWEVVLIRGPTRKTLGTFERYASFTYYDQVGIATVHAKIGEPM